MQNPPVIKQKKPISPFAKFIIFMVVFFGIIGALFTIFSLNDPDVIKYMSNLDPGSVLYFIFIGFIILLTGAIVLVILGYFLFNVNGSTMFWLFIHLILLVLCSPYFLPLLIWRTIIFLTTKTKTESSGSIPNIKEIVEMDDNNIELGKENRKGLFNNFKWGMNFYGKPKTAAEIEDKKKKKEEEKRRIEDEKKKKEEEKKRIEDEKKKKEEEKKRIADEKKTKPFISTFFSKKEQKEEPKEEPKKFEFNVFGGGGDGDGNKKSSLERFTDILLKKDWLWDKLLGVYRIQSYILDTSLATGYNKFMNQ